MFLYLLNLNILTKTKRKEFEKINFSSLEEKLEWIREFFNEYVPELEKRYMTGKEIAEEWVFLPNELRIHFYLYFPEHGLNMANYSLALAHDFAMLDGSSKLEILYD